MMRGVPLGGGIRTERLIEWYYEEQHAEISKTLLLVASNVGADDISGYVKRYIQSVIPTEKTNKEFIEMNAETLGKESSKNYSVKRILMPGEEE